LIAVKVLARDDQTRPQDLADLHALVDAAATSDIDAAHAAIVLITQRGFNRERDLPSLLADVLPGD